MPDISFVYNEVYDSTNTSKSLLKALRLSQPGGVLWLNGDVVFDPQVLPLIQEHIEAGRSFVCVNTESVAEEEVKYTLDDDGYIKELSKQVVGGLGEAVGINFISAEDKATLIQRLDEAGRPGLLRARHRARHRAGRPARRGPRHLQVPHRRGRLRRGPDPGQRVRRGLSADAEPAPPASRAGRRRPGVHLTVGEDTVVDVLFDGRRIWSFWTLRDTRPGTPARWPSGRRRCAASSTAPPGSRWSSTCPAGWSSTRRSRLGTGDRPDRRRRRVGAAARHRQVQPDHHDLRHPRPRPDGSAAGLDRAGALRAARGRGGCVPGVRHPARRHPRAGLHRPRQRRRPRLRQPAHAPARRDPGVLPAAALPARARLRDRPLQRRCLQGRGASRPTAPSAGSTCSAATSSTGGST